VSVRLVLIVLSVVLACPGCGGFYMQAARGHMDLMSRREPIDELLADPDTPQALRERLLLVAEARRFATETLLLPDNDSYTSYAALDRDYVVWNVYATPELSLEPREWCFPVAGCVVYRGYFEEARAREYAAGLAADGMDVFVGGAAAYSTLGRFDDPVISTMMRWDDSALIAILFHELAHQRLYVKDDSAFNEAFATAVEETGMERWFATRADTAGLRRWREQRQRSRAFNRLLRETRAELETVYASGAPEEEMRARKAAAFAALTAAYAELRDSWGGYGGFDGWFELELNNARLVPVATYQRLVPAFRAVLREAGGDLAGFYAACEALAQMTADQRSTQLEARLAISAPGAAAAPGR
jgi:predicted aminopeptidase